MAAFDVVYHTSTVESDHDDDDAAHGVVDPSAVRRLPAPSSSAAAPRLDLSRVPTMEVSSTFLDKVSQSHESALGALGDLIDNSKESRAHTLSIVWRADGVAALATLTLSDDGVSPWAISPARAHLVHRRRDSSRRTALKPRAQKHVYTAEPPRAPERPFPLRLV